MVAITFSGLVFATQKADTKETSVSTNNNPTTSSPSAPVSRLHQLAIAADEVDNSLSNRFIALDPRGYFLIRTDHARGVIEATHVPNAIDDQGRAGRTAKELSVLLLESEFESGPLVSMLVHANYLGREFQKAEAALLAGTEYVQD
eukprot:jgi/Chlat1/5348/Chrsp35S05205